MEIKVFLNRNAEKPCFARIIPFNSSVTVEFNLLLRSMRILFGDDCVVQFNVID